MRWLVGKLLTLALANAVDPPWTANWSRAAGVLVALAADDGDDPVVDSVPTEVGGV